MADVKNESEKNVEKRCKKKCSKTKNEKTQACGEIIYDSTGIEIL